MARASAPNVADAARLSMAAKPSANAPNRRSARGTGGRGSRAPGSMVCAWAFTQSRITDTRKRAEQADQGVDQFDPQAEDLCIALMQDREAGSVEFVGHVDVAEGVVH